MKSFAGSRGGFSKEPLAAGGIKKNLYKKNTKKCVKITFCLLNPLGSIKP
jgi:hypothetical protein